MDCCGGLASNQELANLQEVAPKKVKVLADLIYTREVTTKIEDPTLILARHARIHPQNRHFLETRSLPQTATIKLPSPDNTNGKCAKHFWARTSLQQTSLTQASLGQAKTHYRVTATLRQWLSIRPINRLQRYIYRLPLRCPKRNQQRPPPTTSAPINPAPHIKG